ncbi:hypothetical protein DICSQDRAFT_172861 [Dichomitus squalens LYAD-421 SS1]|uniref:DUF7223 domain-containing protein n=1 Tax=Dichomitus squalens (strain LYAD-421) TaxID=732165 RepID=R7SQZ9_DICSQ|nr:uncharacterized protein DICSQDRAFT_172861 [Dichomitus squalens LYAD-421 SS1]EJF58506.1 hypothetical protein DICSQDRAFT_172861 [Dichomitus squalens LYAD-421 SS1]
MVFSPLLVAALLPIAAQAANDWSQPCFGQCNWDINSGSGSGTVQITGTQSGVSDLTTAAGWSILDCDANTADQDIRLVCQNPDAGCDHVHTDGAAGTLVRLPTSCGSVPFALVTRMWTHQDQSIPANKRALLTRRDGTTPTVKGISLSTNFSQADPSQKGNVTLHLQGSSIPGVATNFTQPPPVDQLNKRGLLSWVGNTLKNIGEIHKNISGSSPINFSKDTPLFDQSINCPQSGAIPAFSGEVKVDLNGKVDGTVNYGVAASGSVIPPKLDQFGLFVGLDTTVTGTLNLDATLTGTVGTGQIPLFQTGIPGLDFPGILSIGPTFSVNAEADASLDANLNMDVDLDYTISGAQLFFPPSSGPSGAFTPGDSKLQLSVSPDVTANGQVTAHLIPTLAFGINALDGKAKATINLDVDAQAGLDLSLTASGKASTATDGSKSADKSFGGCVDVTSGLTVSAGADADFLSIFDKSTSVDLFKKTFDLFKKCFGDSAARRTYTGRKARAELLSKRASIACPSSALASAISVADETVTGSR